MKYCISELGWLVRCHKGEITTVVVLSVVVVAVVVAIMPSWCLDGLRQLLLSRS
jgi:hypothetical protein